MVLSIRKLVLVVLLWQLAMVELLLQDSDGITMEVGCGRLLWGDEQGDIFAEALRRF